jgi:Tol biopolymer transport system component
METWVMNTHMCRFMMIFAVGLTLLVVPSHNPAAVLALRPIERASVSSQGVQANGVSQLLPLGATIFGGAQDRYVVFTSNASNLVPGVPGGGVYLRDRWGQVTELISVDPAGRPFAFATHPSISANGRYVAFAAPNQRRTAIFVRDRAARRTILVDAGGDANAMFPAISANGLWITFVSASSTLTPGDTNGVEDVFVYERTSTRLQRVSVASDGSQADGPSSVAAISASGRYVVFESLASNLSAGDSNGRLDVFLRDMHTAQTVRITVAADGSQLPEGGHSPAISGDGRWVAFVSESAGVVGDDTNGVADVFVWDREAGELRCISRALDGMPGNEASDGVAIARNGSHMAFGSLASNLVPGDTNRAADVFVYDWAERRLMRASVSASGAEADAFCTCPALSADGQYVAFKSPAAALVAEDTNAMIDVFVAPTNSNIKGNPALRLVTPPLVADHNANDNFPLTPGPSPTQAGRGEKCSRMAVARD